MEELLGDFIEESREMLEAVGGEIVAWEAAPGDRERLDTIFRFVHTVKGNCGFLDLPRLAALSHAAEGALAEVRAGRRNPDSALVDAVLAVIDRIAAMVEALDAGEDYPAGGDDALIAALEPGEESDSDAPGPDVDHTSPASGPSAERAPAAPRTIRLPVELLDRVMAGVSDLVLARNDLARRIRALDSEPATRGAFERLATILDDVREGVGRMRMQRLETLFTAFPRLVRDLSSELGKQVMVDIEGGDTELDREMIEVIRDPLTHILRNAIDHGFEPPAERLKAGKREIGLLHIGARQSGNRILISIGDDGRGIDPARVAAKALSAGIVEADEVAGMTDAAKQALVFRPGFSTAEQVTAISGRGVGMDVVRTNIERVGGSIELTSTPGQGTRILLSLPLTLSIVSALTVETGGQLFAIPRSYIEEIVLEGSRGTEAEIAAMGDAALVTVRDRRLRRVSLAQVLGMDSASSPEDNALILIRLAGGDFFAMMVDRVLDHEDMVVKPLAPAVMGTGLYAGTTMLDDGTPVLMLDIAGVARNQNLISDVARRAGPEEGKADGAAGRAAEPALLFQTLDGRRRVVRLGLVTRIEKVAAAAIRGRGSDAQVVIDGEILPLAGLESGAAIPEAGLPLLRLGDGRVELTYAASHILDTIMLHNSTVAADRPGEVEGVTLVDGEAVEVLDSHWLFSTRARASAGKRQLLCRADLADPWVRSILVPLVETAGYRMVGTDHDAPVDIAFASAGTQDGEAGQAGRLVPLTADPDQANDNVLYRYDREGLVAALRGARKGARA